MSLSNVQVFVILWLRPAGNLTGSLHTVLLKLAAQLHDLQQIWAVFEWQPSQGLTSRLIMFWQRIFG